MTGHSITIAIDTARHNPKVHSLEPHQREGHMLIFGTSPTYKPALMWNMMVQDIEAGAGVAVIDVTGQFARPLLNAIPNHRVHACYLFDPADPAKVPGFNPFRGVAEAVRPKVAQDVMELFKAIWNLDYDRTPLLLDLLRSSARVLLDYPDSSFLTFYPLLTDATYRRRIVAHCRDPLTRRFWAEFDAWPLRDQRDKPQPVLTRLRAFLSDPRLRNVLGQVGGKLDIERVVHERQIFLADISACELGAETARLFGCLLATRLQSALTSRRGGWPFYIYLPDAHRVHAAIAAQLLSEQMAPGGAIVSIDQIASQPPEIRSQLLAAETLAAFRVAPDDVRSVVSRFPIPQSEQTIQSLPPDRLVLSEHPYELAALRYCEVLWNSAAAIVRRSRNALGAKFCVVEAMVERFLSTTDP